MSTHWTHCIVCEKETSCNSQGHVLGCGKCCLSKGPAIDFCSLDCFLELSARMWERFRVAEQVAWNGDL